VIAEVRVVGIQMAGFEDVAHRSFAVPRPWATKAEHAVFPVTDAAKPII
jgi:hypothetical protein